METTLKKVHKGIIGQIRGYETYPARSKFDDGYLSALKFVLAIIEKDGRYKDKSAEGEKGK